ncbi:cytotoxic necrotizing factor Rho-activating domain-containing protein [Erwinia oleae]|uniref:cytotoxic necrotizing factor Rho-activating domain-containing protein n=1 Tax=Erwinia oleae TaxID=796334 RepID=UPI000554A789|nr:cytotoxic necrotizing factor Rho-activating domain-containing protein [Erwinia oleae]
MPYYEKVSETSSESEKEIEKITSFCNSDTGLDDIFIDENYSPPPKMNILNNPTNPLAKNQQPIEHVQTFSEAEDLFIDPENDNLKEIIQAEFEKKLPDFIEFRDKGYNIAKLNNTALVNLQKMLDSSQTGTLSQGENTVREPVQKFISTLIYLMQKDHPSSPEQQEAVQQANEAIKYSTLALETIKVAEKLSPLKWQEEVYDKGKTYSEILVSGTFKKITDEEVFSPVIASHFIQRTDEQKKQRLEGLLFSKSNILTAEYKKFSQLQNSLLAESFDTRQRITEYINNTSEKILSAARDFRVYAKEKIVAQHKIGSEHYTSSQQFTYWNLNYKHYSQHLHAVDPALNPDIFAGNPLIQAVRKKTTSNEPIHIKIARAILPISEALSKSYLLLQKIKYMIEPENQDQDQDQDQKEFTDEIKELGKKIKITSSYIISKAENKAFKSVSWIDNKLFSPSNSENVNTTIQDTALELLEKIQQTERILKLLPASTLPLQHAVKQYDRVKKSTLLHVASPELTKQLDKQLEQEAIRWENLKEKSSKRLQEIIDPIIQLAQEKEERRLLSELRSTLKDNISERTEATEHYDRAMAQAIEKLSTIARVLQASVIRLAEHGYSGGKELQEKIPEWLLALSKIKLSIKASVYGTTGSLLNNFSRGGMLARGIGEWGQELKQSYLLTRKETDRNTSAENFDHALLNIIQQNKNLFSKNTDPESKRFLKRVKLALKQAADNNLVYPATPEEILAGSRSVPEDIRNWAEKKIVTGSISLAFRGVKILTSAAFFPVRVTVRGIKTGAKIHIAYGEINKGIKVGQPEPKHIKRKILNQEIGKAAYRLTMSISPVAALSTATLLTMRRMYKDKSYTVKKTLRKKALDISEELICQGGYAGVSAAMRNYYEEKFYEFLENLDDSATSPKYKKTLENYNASTSSDEIYTPAEEDDSSTIERRSNNTLLNTDNKTSNRIKRGLTDSYYTSSSSVKTDYQKINEKFDIWNNNDNAYITTLLTRYKSKKLEANSADSEYEYIKSLTSYLIYVLKKDISDNIEAFNRRSSPSVPTEDMLAEIIYIDKCYTQLGYYSNFDRVTQNIKNTQNYKYISRMLNSPEFFAFLNPSNNIEEYNKLAGVKVFGLDEIKIISTSETLPNFLKETLYYQGNFKKSIMNAAKENQLNKSRDLTPYENDIFKAREIRINNLFKNDNPTLYEIHQLAKHTHHQIEKAKEIPYNQLIKMAEDDFLEYKDANQSAIYNRNNSDWDTYKKLWGKYNKTHESIISDYDTSQLSILYNSQWKPSYNVQFNAYQSALNDLLKDKKDISNLFANNMTDIKSGYQQYALILLMTQKINEITTYMERLRSILLLINDSNPSQTFHETIKFIGKKSIADIEKPFKIEAAKKFTKDFNANLSDREYLDYFNDFTGNVDEKFNPVKVKLTNYVKAKEYILSKYLIGFSTGKNSFNDAMSTVSIQDWDNFDISYLSNAMLAYKVLPESHVRFIPLEQITREANTYSTTEQSFYRVINNYKQQYARIEAKNDAYNMLRFYADNEDIPYNTLIDEPKNSVTYKIRLRSLQPGSNATYDLDGYIKIVRMKNNKVYLISTLADAPIIKQLFAHSPLASNLSQLANDSPDEKPYFDPYIIIDEIYNKYTGFSSKEIIDSNLGFKGNYGYSMLVRYESENQTDKTIAEFFISAMEKTNKKMADKLKDSGRTTPFNQILGLIPFYNVIKRKILDEDYNPSAADMAWDIADVAVSLGLTAASVAYKSAKSLSAIFKNTKKSLLASGKVFKGKALYREILKHSLPEIIKKLPNMEKVAASFIQFSAETFNPLAPFITPASFTYKKTRNIIRRFKAPNSDEISFIRANNVPRKVDAPPTAYVPEDYSDLKFIDEMSDDEINEAIKFLPREIDTDITLKRYAELPEGQCDQAALRTINMLDNYGYKTKVVGCLSYKNVSDTAPLNHYAVLASKDGKELVIDVTFNQFMGRISRNGKILITSWEEWCRKIQNSDKLSNSYVITKDYNSLSLAKNEIAFTDGRNFLESQYIRDPDFHDLNVPQNFTRHIATMYKKDVQRINNEADFIKIGAVDELLENKNLELRNLITREDRFLNAGRQPPEKLADDINAVKRSIFELNELKMTPERVSNYLHMISNTPLNEISKVEFESPVAQNLGSILHSSAFHTNISPERIESINEYGLASVGGYTYLLHDKILYQVTPISRNRFTVYINGRPVELILKDNRWDFKDYNFTTRVSEELLTNPNSALRNKGLLHPEDTTPIATKFDYIRIDKDINMSQPRNFEFSESNQQLHGRIATATGNMLSSQPSSGPRMGKWQVGDIGSNVDFIKLSNGKSGCVGIRIPLDSLHEGNAVIISGGQLSGCTMIFSTDHKYFYAYHAGQHPGDTNWLTSREGVNSIYQAHLSLKGTRIPSFENKALSNKQLPELFSEYHSSTINYLGKSSPQTGSTHIPEPAPYSGINAFDYNQAKTVRDNPRLGVAYAVLSKKNGEVRVTSHSEDLSFKFNSSEPQTLSSQYNLLKGEPTAEDVVTPAINALSDAYNTFIVARVTNEKTNQ